MPWIISGCHQVCFISKEDLEILLSYQTELHTEDVCWVCLPTTFVDTYQRLLFCLQLRCYTVCLYSSFPPLLFPGVSLYLLMSISCLYLFVFIVYLWVTFIIIITLKDSFIEILSPSVRLFIRILSLPCQSLVFPLCSITFHTRLYTLWVKHTSEILHVLKVPQHKISRLYKHECTLVSHLSLSLCGSASIMLTLATKHTGVHFHKCHIRGGCVGFTGATGIGWLGDQRSRQLWQIPNCDPPCGCLSGGMLLLSFGEWG